MVELEALQELRKGIKLILSNEVDLRWAIKNRTGLQIKRVGLRNKHYLDSGQLISP